MSKDIRMTFDGFTYVLDIGKRCSSLPASRITKCVFPDISRDARFVTGCSYCVLYVFGGGLVPG